MSCQALRNVPRKKLDIALIECDKIQDERKKYVKKKALHRYFEANIPVKYWELEMKRDFNGDKSLMMYYDRLTQDINTSYKAGSTVCFAGNYGIGKMIDLNTDLPTPNGFIKLIDLKQGDQLFDENGDVCNVIKLHDIDLKPESYRITFDDGSTINACADHLWQTYTLDDRKFDIKIKSKHKRREQRKNSGIIVKPWLCKEDQVKPDPTIKTTKCIFNSLKVNNVINHSIICSSPVKYKEKDLKIHPYVLGAWLGDGDSRSGLIESADYEVIENIKSFGYEVFVKKSSVRSHSKSCSYKIGNYVKHNGVRYLKLTYDLKSLGVLKNKHIPDEYLLGSIEQRLSLLQGLMDTDGHITKQGLCEFCSVNEKLACQVKDLILSLGIKTKVNRNKYFLNGKRCEDKFSITFTTDLDVFKLKRKKEIIIKKKAQKNKTTHRYIVNVEKIDSIPMRCITVDSPSHLFLVTKSYIPTHNTLLVTNVLKRALEKGYSGLFVNLNDIISAMTSGEQFKARQELLKTDFLVIDEFDPRYMANKASSDFYGRVLEDLLRNRTQNTLPILMCTNSPNPNLSFEGSLQQSISSLFNYVDLVPSLGEDYRPKEIK